MTSLPAYVEALKKRHKGQQQVNSGSMHNRIESDTKVSYRRNDENRTNDVGGDFGRLKAEHSSKSRLKQSCRKLIEDDDPLIIFSPVKPSKRLQTVSNITEEILSDHQKFSGSPKTDEVKRLEQENVDLHAEYRDLEQQIRSLQHKHRDLVSEMSAMKAENQKAAQLSKDLAAAEREIAELTQLIKSKDTHFASLDRDYRALENDYNRRCEMRAADSETLRLRQMELARLQKELDQYRSSSRFDEPEHEPIQRSRPRAIPEGPAPVVKRSFGQVPAAMRDNLRFGADENPSRAEIDFPVEEMSDRELKSRLANLTRERDEKERKLSKAAPKGSNVSHVRRQKEELDAEIIELGKQISKLRLELKRREVY
jgi:chromosome segregation ATPase